MFSLIVLSFGVSMFIFGKMHERYEWNTVMKRIK
jgi:hypothetical protein